MTAINGSPTQFNLTFSFSLAGTGTIDRAQAWWNHLYPYRRRIKITAPPSGLEAGHPITVYLDRASIVGQNKVLGSFEDMEVLYLASSAPEHWKAVSRNITETDTQIIVKFDTVAALAENAVSDAAYYVYYGNKSLKNKPLTRTYTPATRTYPLTVNWNDPGITFTRAGQWWSDNVSDVRHAKASFSFYGDQIKLHADKGPAYGIAEVQIDDGAWEQVDLYANSSNAVSDTEVYNQTGLSEDRHTIRVRVSGNKNPSASSTQINLTKITYRKNPTVVDVKEETDATMLWGSIFGGVE
jgi:hypothetical protein